MNQGAEISRRTFLKATGTLAASSCIAMAAAGQAADAKTGKSQGCIDTNVSLGRWPFRRLPLDDTASLVAKLRKNGVKQAWAGSFEGLLQRDIASVNARLAEECSRFGQGILVPFGSINPMLPDWEEDMRRCQEMHRMPGIRLNPNYHGYTVEDRVFARVIDVAARRNLLVQLAVGMEDERTQNPAARAADVDLSRLPELMQGLTEPRIILLNWFRAAKGALLQRLGATQGVYFDIATVEGVGGLGNLLKTVPAERVLFGSHAPFFYFESARFKLAESVLTQEQWDAIQGHNARKLLGRN